MPRSASSRNATEGKPRATRSAGGSARNGASPGTSARARRSTSNEPPAKRVAAIDIGSNSIRQIVADVSPDGAIRIVDEMKAAPRLGAGLSATGALSPVSVERAVDALGRMSTLAKQLGARRIEAVATSAVREASNRREFLAQVRQRTGLRVRVLSGSEEARLSYRSALAHFDLGHGRTIVMDIGGGSLELALCADGLLDRLASLPLGSIRMTEEFLGREPRRRDVSKLRRKVRDELRGLLPVREWRGAHCIGSGGTFTNLAGMFLARSNINMPRSVHGTLVPREEVEAILDHLQELSPAERLALPGLNAGRADIIVAGLAVAAETMRRFQVRGLRASAYGIREGLLLEVARVTPTVSDPGKARERSLQEFAQRSSVEEQHARTVQRLALQLFDALGARLGLGQPDRRLLAEAAMLHEVGHHISYSRHHKHSYHLIMHAELLGMPPEEQIIIANVARYHRGAEPRKKHSNLGALAPDARRRIRALAALLRVADGLDRGHTGSVKQVRVRWTERALRLTLKTDNAAPGALRLESWGGARKAGLLARLAGVPVEVIAPDGTLVSTADELSV